MNMIFGVKDRPKFGQTILFAIQQLLAIMAATLVVPVITNGATGSTLSPAAALFGAGVGTLVYLLFTKFRSPVFLGSSFAFLGSMAAAFAGGVSMTLGYAGLILGAVFAGFVYVIIAAAVKVAGVKWLDRLMPVVVIGPTVSIIGLSLAGNAVSDLVKGSVVNAEGAAVASPLITVLCGLVALLVTMLCATYGKKMVRLIPFILGILAGYAVAAVFTLIGNATATDALKVLDFSKLSVLWENGVTLKTFVNYELVTKDFVFLKAAKGFAELNWGYVSAIAVAYVPVAFVVFAEHIADHKNISSIIGKDLLKDPGLSRTLLGDGVGSMAGALLGGCPNTTYGESVACVAITRNASVVTILATAILAMLGQLLLPVRRLRQLHPRLRYGRRVHRPVRLHRGLRPEDDPAGRPRQGQQPLRRQHDPRDRHRRPVPDVRQDHDHAGCRRAHPRHPCQPDPQGPQRKPRLRPSLIPYIIYTAARCPSHRAAAFFKIGLDKCEKTQYNTQANWICECAGIGRQARLRGV